MGVAGANMQWGHFVSPLEGEHELVLQSTWGLLSPDKQICRSIIIVLHVENGAKFGVEKVNGGKNKCSIDTSVGNGRILKNKLNPL